MNFKNIFTNCSIFLVATIAFLFLAEWATRTFWNVGYSHQYDWRDRAEGYSSEKPKGVYRILVIGDSIAYGQGVRREDTFAKLVENKLNRNKTEKKYEVVNIAQPGINTADEYYEFINKGLQYSPDMILIAYFINDLGNVHYNKIDNTQHPNYIRSSLNRQHWEWAIPFPYWFEKVLVNNSDFYLFLMRRYDSLLKTMGIRSKKNYDSNTLAPYLEKGKDWEYMLYYLYQMNAKAKKEGIKPIITIIPDFYKLKPYPFKYIHQEVEKIANLINLPVLDLLPVFYGKDSFNLVVSKIDSHPNKLAHEMMAEEIYKFLVNKKLF